MPNFPNVTDNADDVLASQYNALANGALPNSGWSAVDITWTYASASTITVPSGAASLYVVGDKIKLTQTTVKYFYIVAVADALLTVTGGSDYSVANAAISAISYSHAVSPVGFPGYFNTAAISFNVAIFDNASGGQPLTVFSIFSIKGNEVHHRFRATGTKGATDTGNIIYTRPAEIPAQTPASQNMCLGTGWLGDNYVSAQIYTYSGGTDCYIHFIGATVADNVALNTNGVSGDVSYFF